MKLKNKLELDSTLKVGAIPTASTSNFSVLFENGGTVSKRVVGDIINKNSTDFIQGISNSFPSIFNYNTSTTPSDSNLVVSFKNQLAGTVFAAPTTLNGTPSFRKLIDSDLSETSIFSQLGNYVTLDTEQDITGKKVFSAPYHKLGTNSAHVEFGFDGNPSDSIMRIISNYGNQSTQMQYESYPEGVGFMSFFRTDGNITVSPFTLYTRRVGLSQFTLRSGTNAEVFKISGDTTNTNNWFFQMPNANMKFALGYFTSNAAFNIEDVKAAFRGSIYSSSNIFANGFKKHNSSDDHVLLGGGGHKLISDFALSTDIPDVSNFLEKDTSNSVTQDFEITNGLRTFRVGAGYGAIRGEFGGIYTIDLGTDDGYAVIYNAGEGHNFGAYTGGIHGVNNGNNWGLENHNVTSRMLMPETGNANRVLTTGTKVGANTYYANTQGIIELPEYPSNFLVKDASNEVTQDFEITRGDAKFKPGEYWAIEGEFEGVSTISLGSDDVFALTFMMFNGDFLEAYTGGIYGTNGGKNWGLTNSNDVQSNMAMPDTDNIERVLTTGAKIGSTTYYANMQGIIELPDHSGNYLKKDTSNTVTQDFEITNGWGVLKVGDTGAIYGEIPGIASIDLVTEDGFAVSYRMNDGHDFEAHVGGIRGNNGQTWSVENLNGVQSYTVMPETGGTYRVLTTGAKLGSNTYYANNQGIVELPDYPDVSGFVPNTRTITAGNGLSGGGNLTANRTIALGTPSPIGLSTTNSVTSTSHTHALDSDTITEINKGQQALTNIGTLNSLTTTDKSNLVNAINEVNGKSSKLINEYFQKRLPMNADAVQGVILLCDITNDTISADRFFKGRIALKRNNSLNGQNALINIDVAKYYNNEQPVCNYYGTFNKQYIRFVTVIYNSRKYVALDISNITSSYTWAIVEGFKNESGHPTDILYIPYYNSNTSVVINSEINNSIEPVSYSTEIYSQRFNVFGNVESRSFIKTGQNDTQLLLAGGGHRPVSDFALANGCVALDPTVINTAQSATDFNTIVNNSVSYISSAVPNRPNNQAGFAFNMAITASGGTGHGFTIHGGINGEDNLFYRRRLGGVNGSNFQVASREWANGRFALADSLSDYLLLAGGTMTGDINFSTANTLGISKNGIKRLRFTTTETVLSSTVTGSTAGIVFRPQGDSVSTSQVTINGNGQINTYYHGNSSQWKQAYDWVSLGGVSRTSVSLNSSNDLDLVVESGYYHHIGGSAPLNKPVSGAIAGYLEVVNTGAGGPGYFIRQTWRGRDNRLEYQRTRSSLGDWSDWVVYYNSDNFNPSQYVLQSALNTQLANYVPINGVTTINNTKTFTSSPIVPNATLNGHAVNLGQVNSLIAGVDQALGSYIKKGVHNVNPEGEPFSIHANYGTLEWDGNGFSFVTDFEHEFRYIEDEQAIGVNPFQDYGFYLSYQRLRFSVAGNRSELLPSNGVSKSKLPITGSTERILAVGATMGGSTYYANDNGLIDLPSSDGILSYSSANGIIVTDWNSFALSEYAMSLGYGSVTSGNYATSVGGLLSTTGFGSTNQGYSNSITKALGYSLGAYNSVRATLSGVFGIGLVNRNDGAFIVGRYNSELPIVPYDTTSPHTQAVFAIGAGRDDTDRYTAVTVFGDGRADYTEGYDDSNWTNNTLVTKKWVQDNAGGGLPGYRNVNSSATFDLSAEYTGSVVENVYNIRTTGTVTFIGGTAVYDEGYKITIMTYSTGANIVLDSSQGVEFISSSGSPISYLDKPDRSVTFIYDKAYGSFRVYHVSELLV